MSPDIMKALATFLSWAIMITLIAIVIGGIILLFETVITVRVGLITTGFAEWFAGIFSLSIGLGILTIGIIISGSFLMAILIAILMKNGQQFLLNIITQLEE